MSDRLIDANTLTISCKQVNDMPCIYADLPNWLDGNHYIVEQSESNRESRWFKLFGTPELAARTLAGICENCKYGDCVTCGVPEWADYSHDYDALLEWLRGDAE